MGERYVEKVVVRTVVVFDMQEWGDADVVRYEFADGTALDVPVDAGGWR